MYVNRIALATGGGVEAVTEEEIVGHLPQHVGDALDDTATPDFQKGLGLSAHARAPASRLDHAGEPHDRPSARRPMSLLHCIPSKRMRPTAS